MNCPSFGGRISLCGSEIIRKMLTLWPRIVEVMKESSANLAKNQCYLFVEVSTLNLGCRQRLTSDWIHGLKKFVSIVRICAGTQSTMQWPLDKGWKDLNPYWRAKICFDVLINAFISGSWTLVKSDPVWCVLFFWLFFGLMMELFVQ